MRNLVAIGCGGAGMFSLIVANQLRKGKFTATVLSDEQDVYCRCTSPYILTGEAELADAIQPECMFADYGLTIVHDRAVRIDTRQRVVVGESGTEYPYDSLVVATGARAFVPPIPGADGARVHTVRTSEDMEHIGREAADAKHAVVIGAGVIGMEMAGALREKGVGVTLVEASAGISSDLADPEFAERLVSHLKERGIETVFSGKVTGIRDDASGRKEVVVKTGDTERVIGTDLVIVAAGVRPNLDVVEGSGIRTSKQGIPVDDRMRTNVSDVYACGDCSMPPFGVTGEHRSSGLASGAIQQAKIVGFQLAGFPIRYKGSTGAAAFRTLGREFAVAGLTETAARERFRFVVTGVAETTDVYRDLKGNKPLSVKLVFAGPRLRLVGYQAFGNGVIASADVASFAIGQRTGILRMLRYNYIAHPSLSPWPFMDPIIMATEDAMGKLMKRFSRTK
ncbi:MAG: FAD-dependent oxidoreductase [Candidatus Moranbacteria bacterium]|nr:FAD-dependent oxidoreductase [Candidatus Moranbacteria bacterium]